MQENGTFTRAQWDALDAVIADMKNKPGPLMPVMQTAQEIFGFLPAEVQREIAGGLGVTLSDVYGVATFYSQFTMEPRGQHLIGVCLGTACYVKNADKILAEIAKQLDVEVGRTTADNKFTLEATRCLGCCGLAPVIMIDDTAYGNLVPGDIAGILAKY